MQKNHLKTIFFTAIVALFVNACTEKQKNEAQGNVNQSAMLANYTQVFETKLAMAKTDLSTLSTTYSSYSNGNASLEDVKLALTQANKSYNGVSFLDFGPAVNNGEMLNDRFNIFPVNSIQVEDNARNGLTDIDNQFKSSVGFASVEYLLYNAATAFTDGEQALKTGNVNANINALISNMLSKISALENAYKTGFSNAFAENTGSSDGSSMAQFTNAFVMNFETNLRNNKLRIPIGKFNGGMPLPEKAEAFYSDNGLLLASEQLKNLKEIYSLSGDSLSLSSYLVSLGEADLDADIRTQFDFIESAYSNLVSKHGNSLTSAINNSNDELSALIDEHQKLIPLLKGNMLSAFGVRINYADSDGD